MCRLVCLSAASPSCLRLPPPQETRAILISADCAQSLYPALSSCRADTVAAAATLPGCCSWLQALAQDCINQALFYVGDDAQAVQSGSDEL